MGNAKRTVIVVGLVAIILLSVVLTVHFMRERYGAVKPPAWVDERPVTKIDADTGEVMTKPLGEWNSLGYDKRGYCKNPETGAYTMADAVTCEFCGTKYPGPVFPKDLDPMDPNYLKILADSEKDIRCPQCGRRPSLMGGD